METHGGQAVSSKVQKRLSLWSNGTCESESEDVKALIFMGRLQQWIYRYRVRVKEFFKVRRSSDFASAYQTAIISGI